MTTNERFWSGRKVSILMNNFNVLEMLNLLYFLRLKLFSNRKLKNSKKMIDLNVLLNETIFLIIFWRKIT